MAKIRPGFTLNLLDGSIASDQILISSGSRKHASPGHAADCMVSRGDCRALTPAEWATLTNAAPGRISESVCLLDLGGEILQEGRRSLLPTLVDTDPFPDAQAEILRQYQSLVARSLQERYGIVAETTGAADLVAKEPHLVSTAFNPKIGAYLGLHIDSHQRLALRDRAEAMTVVSINVGFADRYLDFVNLPVHTLHEEVADREPDEPGRANNLKAAFFAKFPDYPVLRLVIRPGQAYLCNTQNTIHDGATNGTGRPDVSFMTMHRLSDTVPTAYGAAVEHA